MSPRVQGDVLLTSFCRVAVCMYILIFFLLSTSFLILECGMKLF